MGFLAKLFGRKPAAGEARENEPGPAAGAQSPATIKVYDSYGRTLEIPRENWRRDVLLPNIEKSASDPDALYQLIVQALNDGFVDDALVAVHKLRKLDPIPLRAACLHGVVLLQLQRFSEARELLESATAKHGEEGYVVTNIAKAYVGLGEPARAEQILWHALELDPNQENGLGWYASIHAERAGKAGGIAAYERVATLPGSWRAQLWLARAALERSDLASAMRHYHESLSKLPQVPADVLMQISGDLGNNGQLAALVELCRPHFDVAAHGLAVGNNLIKAYVDLKETNAARAVLEQLYAQQRPDWRDTLVYWEQQIDAAERRYGPVGSTTPLEMSVLTLDQPVWAHGTLGFDSLLPMKTTGGPLVLLVCGSGDAGENGDQVRIQQSDDLGRATRALPMFLAEELRLRTNARSCFVLPWIARGGFILSAKPWHPENLGLGALNAELVLMLHIDARAVPWRLQFSLYSDLGSAAVDTWEVSMDLLNIAPAVHSSCERLMQSLGMLKRGPAPIGLGTPPNAQLTQYLVAIEQALAVATASMEGNTQDLLHAERSILDNMLMLAVDAPSNVRTRCLLVNTLEKEARRRPDIVREYWEKLMRLQKEHPLPPGPAAQRVAAAVTTLAEKIRGQ